MGFEDFFFGQPPSTQVAMAPGYKPPGYGMAQSLSRYLQGLIGQAGPQYQGRLDPGMSPTMSMLGQMLQGYSTSPAPYILGQAAGTLGGFMNPTFGNPALRLQSPGIDWFTGGSPGGRPGVMPGSSLSLPPLQGLLSGPPQGGTNLGSPGEISVLSGGLLGGGGAGSEIPYGSDAMPRMIPGSGGGMAGSGSGWETRMPLGPLSKPALPPPPPLPPWAATAVPRGKAPLSSAPRGVWSRNPYSSGGK